MGYYQRLKDLKEDSDLTQKQVSDIIGVSTNHYGKYERGETDIPFEKAIVLAKYYDVSLDYLAGRTNFRHGRANPDLSAEQARICDIYSALSERSKGKLELFAEQLFERERKAGLIEKGTG